MSLIETMITLGIASGLVLAVMEAVKITTQQVKNATTSNDWTTIVSNIRLLLQNANQCTCAMGPSAANFVYGTSAFSASGAQIPLMYLNAVNIYSAGPSGLLGTSCGPTGSPLLSVTPLNGVQIAAAPSGIAIYTTWGDNSWVIPSSPNAAAPAGSGPSGVLTDTVEMDIMALKITGAYAVQGTSAMGGGGEYLYATNLLTNRTHDGLMFQITRDMTLGTILSCYSTTDQAQQACYNLGGIYANPSSIYPICQLENLQLGRDNLTGTAATVGPAAGGQKLGLWRYNNTLAPASSLGGFGVPNKYDYAIGVDSNSMWFNSGGATLSNGFTFRANGGGDLNDVPMGNSGAPSMLASLYPSNPTGLSPGWIVNVTESHYGAMRSQYLGTENHFQDNEFHTGTFENHLYANEEHSGGNEWHETDNEEHQFTNEWHSGASETHLQSFEFHTGSYEYHTGLNENHFVTFEYHTGGINTQVDEAENHDWDNEIHLASNELHTGFGFENHVSQTEYHTSGYDAHLGLETENHLSDYEYHSSTFEVHSGANEVHVASNEWHTSTFENHESTYEYHDGGYELHESYENHLLSSDYHMWGYDGHNYAYENHYDGYELHYVSYENHVSSYEYHDSGTQENHYGYEYHQGHNDFEGIVTLNDNNAGGNVPFSVWWFIAGCGSGTYSSYNCGSGAACGSGIALGCTCTISQSWGWPAFIYGQTVTVSGGGNSADGYNGCTCNMQGQEYWDGSANVQASFTGNPVIQILCAHY